MSILLAAISTPLAQFAQWAFLAATVYLASKGVGISSKDE